MSLDPSRTEQAYQLGRLFAELQKTQEDAFPGITNTIKDRYFSRVGNAGNCLSKTDSTQSIPFEQVDKRLSRLS